VNEQPDKPTRILFVCLANMCRSPMARIIAREVGGDTIEADSAGVAPAMGPIFPDTRIYVRDLLGVDLVDHEPRHVLEYPVAHYDYIIAMDSSVFMTLTEMQEIPRDKLYGWDIPDPCGLGADAYERTAQAIEANLERFLQHRDMEKTFKGGAS
jgi:protein-tyrosine-phosphatase